MCKRRHFSPIGSWNGAYRPRINAFFASQAPALSDSGIVPWWYTHCPCVVYTCFNILTSTLTHMQRNYVLFYVCKFCKIPYLHSCLSVCSNFTPFYVCIHIPLLLVFMLHNPNLAFMSLCVKYLYPQYLHSYPSSHRTRVSWVCIHVSLCVKYLYDQFSHSCLSSILICIA